MKNNMFLFALCLSACFSKDDGSRIATTTTTTTTATTDAEVVWLKDVTTRLQSDKRGATGPDFPDQLSFHLERKTHDLVLNLKRNYLINPNIDTYIVQRIMDGQPLLEKIQNLEQADVAYYQDIDNGAFMTARCVKRSCGQGEILINGYIRFGDRRYNLRPSAADVIPNDFLEITGLRGKRYVLQDQEHIQSGMPAKNNEQANVIEQNVQDNHFDRLRRITYGQDKPNLVINPDDIFSARPNVARLQNRFPTGAINYGRTITKNHKARQRNNYYVDVVAMADLGLWKFFFGLANSSAVINPAERALVELREYLIHIVHGVNQLYKGIEDPSISITVRIKSFVIYKTEHFQHISSTVQEHEGKMKIDGDKYLQDLKYWDFQIGSKNLQDYDQVILFTRHLLYSGNPDDTEDDGRSDTASVCDLGRRVQIVRVSDFFKTTRTAAHGLGHALGAPHDSFLGPYSCKAEDKLIMSPQKPTFYPQKIYTQNPWLFSRCSVEAFKSTLVHKRCVKTIFVHDQDIVSEFQRVLRTPTGQRYDLNQQCVFSNGYGSRVSRKVPESICGTIGCTDTATNRWDKKYIPAATGTICGNNKTCQKGLCVELTQ